MIRSPLPSCYAKFAAEAFRRFEAGERPGKADVGDALGWSRARSKAAFDAMWKRGLWTWTASLGARTIKHRVDDPGLCCDCDRPFRRYHGHLMRYRCERGMRCNICYRDENRLRAAEGKRAKRAEAVKAAKTAKLAGSRNLTPRPRSQPD